MGTPLIGIDADIVASPSAISAVEGLAVRDVLLERIEQIDLHGFTPAHDLEQGPIDIALAAFTFAGVALDAFSRPTPACIPTSWPFKDGFKPAPDPRGNLVKAAALILAAIDCIDAGGAPTCEAPIAPGEVAGA